MTDFRDFRQKHSGWVGGKYNQRFTFFAISPQKGPKRAEQNFGAGSELVIKKKQIRIRNTASKVSYKYWRKGLKSLR